MKKSLFVIAASLLCFSGISKTVDKIIPLKDKQETESEYASILIFRLNDTDKSQINSQYITKNRTEVKAGYTLRYFDGSNLAQVPINFVFSRDINTGILNCSSLIYLAAKPGRYDLFALFGGAYHFSLNAVVELQAGKAYYAGEINIYEDKNGNFSLNIFKNITINDSIVHDFENKYPNTFISYKNDLIPAILYEPTPVQPTKVVFSSHFTKDEGIWKESDDSLHKAFFENGQYCIESKSAYNCGNEIIELHDVPGTTFDIELRCKWKSGVTNYRFGFIIPGGIPWYLKGKIVPLGYMFGISANGYAGIWFESVKMLGKVKNVYTLTGWKNLVAIKTNGFDSNTIRLQVIDNVITFYVNDQFVDRAPHNGDPDLTSYIDYVYPFNKLLGIFSDGKQKIEFDEIQVSKFK